MKTTAVFAGCVLLCSCVYSPPKGVATVPFTIRAVSAPGTAKVCSGGQWVPLGGLAVTSEQHAREVIKWDGNAFSNNLPAGREVLLHFTAFGGITTYGKEKVCEVVVRMHTEPGKTYRADLKDVGYGCRVDIGSVDSFGAAVPVRTVPADIESCAR